jgi:hypothetical protein
MKGFISFVLILCFFGCTSNSSSDKSVSSCSDKCEAKSKTTELSCKLTSSEAQLRKETVIASLKEQMIERKELENGYAFKFKGTDKVINELVDFIKTERQCCDFFIFNLSISGDTSAIWLELTGPEGTKEFIGNEIKF